MLDENDIKKSVVFYRTLFIPSMPKPICVLNARIIFKGKHPARLKSLEWFRLLTKHSITIQIQAKRSIYLDYAIILLQSFYVLIITIRLKWKFIDQFMSFFQGKLFPQECHILFDYSLKQWSEETWTVCVRNSMQCIL